MPAGWKLFPTDKEKSDPASDRRNPRRPRRAVRSGNRAIVAPAGRSSASAPIRIVPPYDWIAPGIRNWLARPFTVEIPYVRNEPPSAIARDPGGEPRDR